MTVAGKGTIDMALAGSAECFTDLSVLQASRMFSVSGGSGAYVGASGGGTLRHAVYRTFAGGAGTDTWIGTLSVPGLEFDVTRPIFSGASSRTARTPAGRRSVRVRLSVKATDEVDGARPVACSPRSGSRFRIGRTLVACAATDRSGNTAKARFVVTVLAGR